MTNLVFGPFLGLRTPVVPTAKGPSSRAHSTSVLHSGQVAMSAHRSKNAEGGTADVVRALMTRVVMDVLCAHSSQHVKRVAREGVRRERRCTAHLHRPPAPPTYPLAGTPVCSSESVRRSSRCSRIRSHESACRCAATAS